MIQPELSAIVIVHNGRPFLPECLKTLSEELSAFSHELIVVDNGSNDGSVQYIIEAFPQTIIIRNDVNLGFARAVNQGLRKASGRKIYLLNQDLRFRTGGTTTLMQKLDSSKTIGAVGPKFVGFDGSLQRSARGFPALRHVWYDLFGLSTVFSKSREFGHWRMSWFDHDSEREVDQPMGAALMLRREVVERVGFFDERFKIFFNDVDYCRRIWKAGFTCTYVPDAVVEHFVGSSTRKTPFLSVIRSHHSMVRYLLKYTRPHLLPGWVLTSLVLYCGGLVRGLFAKLTSGKASS